MSFAAKKSGEPTHTTQIPLILSRTIGRQNLPTLLATILIFVTLGGTAIRNAIGWIGWGIVLAVTFAGVVLWAVFIARAELKQKSEQLLQNWRRFPIPLALFIAWAFLSTIWSYFRIETLMGSFAMLLAVIVGTLIAWQLSWREIARALDWATRVILSLSLLFELIAATFIQHPIAPAWANAETLKTLQPQNMWTEANLFAAGKIHGILGNSIDLSLVAAIALIVLSARMADHHISKRYGMIYLALAGGMLVLARSTTIILALTVAAAIATLVFIRRWLVLREEVRLFWLGIISLGFAVLGATAILADQILELFGKSGDLTGRTDLWENVLEAIRTHNVFGIGWVGYWPPWIAEFKQFTPDWPMHQVHAHNAWLDVWLQLGLVGLALFIANALLALWNAWRHAVHARLSASRVNALSVVSLMLLVLLMVQSSAESMMLIEGVLVLLVMLSVKSNQRNLPSRNGTDTPPGNHIIT